MRYTFHIICLLLMFSIIASASDNLQTQILAAKNKVLPALVHIEPVKEVFSEGKRIKVQVTGSGVIATSGGSPI